LKKCKNYAEIIATANRIEIKFNEQDFSFLPSTLSTHFPKQKHWRHFCCSRKYFSGAKNVLFARTQALQTNTKEVTVL
jgi:hypothetical protein